MIYADLDIYLQMLAGPSPAGKLIEIRHTRRGGGMGQLFVPARRPELAARAVIRLSPTVDVYTGVLLRTRRRGGRDSVHDSHLLFVEIDHPDAQDRLDRFRHPPTATISSGGPGHRHAYYALHQPINPARLVDANRRLAHALGGDLASVDASRILRPPSTVNRKHTPPAPVTLIAVDRSRRYDADELLDGLNDPPTRGAVGSGTSSAPHRRVDDPLAHVPAHEYVRRLAGLEPDRTGKVACPFHELSVGRAGAAGVLPARSLADASLTDDPLRLVPPPVYFERLTGLQVGPSGKVHCLFHDDRSPSLHVYREPGRGWYCFGCGRGGSVFDLAALLCRRGTRGSDFVELRRVLEQLLL